MKNSILMLLVGALAFGFFGYLFPWVMTTRSDASMTMGFILIVAVAVFILAIINIIIKDHKE